FCPNGRPFSSRNRPSHHHVGEEENERKQEKDGPWAIRIEIDGADDLEKQSRLGLHGFPEAIMLIRLIEMLDVCRFIICAIRVIRGGNWFQV
ncbi:MAG TPA: hypothetical protein VGK74_22755, partial [Symbiobacteriaceae bacterium]